MRDRQSPGPRRFAPGGSLAVLLLLAATFQLVPATGVASLRVQDDSPDARDAPRTVLVPEGVVASMNERFLEFNEHWDEAPRMNRITQMLRSGGPTQLEYMGCLQGEVEDDTVRIRGWEEARDLVQLQFGVGGSCEDVPDLLGTWHTHPFRADVYGHPVKTRGLSRSDLESFAGGDHRLLLVLWDVDSLTVALRSRAGEVVHPAPTVTR